MSDEQTKETGQSMSDAMSETGVRQGPAARYQHDHPPIRNVIEESNIGRSLGQRIADRVTIVVGGWPFIIVQSVLLCVWIGLNIYLARHWKDTAFDPYPFILLNLMLSFQAAYTGPIVMMSQNRQAQKDRLTALSDYECNMKAEEEIRIIMEHLAYQDKLLTDILRKLDDSRPEQEAGK